MLQRSESSTQKYSINPGTVVTVRNTEAEDALGKVYFKTAVTLRHTTSRDKPLTFEDNDAISDYILNIDLLDDQTAMNLDEVAETAKAENKK